MKQSQKPLSYLLVKPAGPDCNLACGYCFYSRTSERFQNSTHRMDETVLNILTRQAIEQSGPHICFAWQGGEPSLMGLDFYKNAVQLQKHYAAAAPTAKKVENALQSNGILLDRSWADFLAEQKFLVGLSLDGPEELHNSYRIHRDGRGSHARVESNAQVLLNAGVETNIISTVHAGNCEYAEDLFDYFTDLGFTYLQFIPILEADPQHPEQPAAYSLSAAAYGDFLCALFDRWENAFSQGLPQVSIRFFDDLLGRYLGAPTTECVRKKCCGDYLVVEHNGEVYSCDFFVEDSWFLGSIQEKQLIDMLNSPRQDLFGKRKQRLPKECLHCPFLELCRGGCPKDRQRIHGKGSLNHFCSAYKQFFSHADPFLREAAQYIRQHYHRKA